MDGLPFMPRWRVTYGDEVLEIIKRWLVHYVHILPVHLLCLKKALDVGLAGQFERSLLAPLMMEVYDALVPEEFEPLVVKLGP
jgi:hypothetical protein